MQVSTGVRTERIQMAEELDGLQFAAELELDGIAENEVVCYRHRQRLERFIVQAGIGWGKAARRQADGGTRSIFQVVRVAGAYDRSRNSLAVTDVTAKGKTSGGEQGALDPKTGAHVRAGAISSGSRTGHKGERAAGLVMRFLDYRCGIVEDAKDRAIGRGAKSPFPIIVVGKVAYGAELHCAQQGVVRDIDIEARTRAQADLFAQGRQERRSGDLHTIEAGKQSRGGVKPCSVGEDGQATIAGAQNLDYGAHLRSAGRVAHVAGDRAGLSSPHGQRQPDHNHPTFKRA